MANAKAFTHEKKNVPAGRKPQPILICPYCGRRLTLTSWGNAYRCGQAAFSGIAECRTIHVDRERLENAVLSCTRTMAGMVAAEVSRKKKEWAETAAIEEETGKLEAEKKRLSSRKLRLYEDYRSGRITKEQYRKEYENTASRILEIEKRIPELKEEIMKVREQMLHMKEREAELEGLESLETFDKGRLVTVIDSVQVYSEERIEIVWMAGLLSVGRGLFLFFHVVENVLDVFVFFELVEELVECLALLGSNFLEVVGDALELG